MVPTENLEDLAEIENKPISEHALAGYFYLCFNRALFILDIDFSVKKKNNQKTSSILYNMSVNGSSWAVKALLNSSYNNVVPKLVW